MARRAARRALAAAFLLAAALAAAAGAAGEEPAGTFGETVEVPLVTLVVRVVDTWGNPILGLGPEDLRVRVGRRELPVLALDWVGAAEGPAAAPAPPAGDDAPDTGGPAAPTAAPGRLVVLFVQADLNPTRISGQLRLRPYTRELLGTLHPGDRVAVASFDSHLKLWQDFATDAAATHAAVDRAMVFTPEAPVAAADGPSLARHLDRAAARDAASPERALELLGSALAKLPGEKTVLFLGWGLGRFDSSGVRMTPDYRRAVRALAAARAAVFVLDVTSADAHSLAVGLESVAAATGGLYLSTYRLPGLATRTLARAISGHYVLTLDGAALGDRRGNVEVDLRRRLGTVLARTVELR